MSEKDIPKYIPLYRKYRPKTLQEVVGQEHIKKSLANAINLNKISHAYLFTGPRGTGKTSIARIMAKSLNCQQGPTLTPCGVCPSCLDIINSVPIDVIEIDAASNRKVEDAQNILEKIQYVPVNGRFKIYIIDEVHMLSNHAFNALLKTLEEPPENVIFILATTEPQKVLETITSRCQRFDFRRITTADIVEHLKNVSNNEKIKITEDALFTIAKNAAGGMRDSLALLDQASVLDAGREISTEDINALLGRLSFDVLNTLSESIINSDAQTAIENLEKIYNSGNEPVQILTNLAAYFKNVLIVKNCQSVNLTDLTQLNEHQIKILKTQAEKLDTHQIIFLIEKITYYIKELKTTNNQHMWLEIAMIDLANLANNTSLLDLQNRVARLEGGLPPISSVQSYVTQPAPIPTPQIKPEQAKREEVKPVSKIVESEKNAEKEAKEVEIKQADVQQNKPVKPNVAEASSQEAPQQEEFSPVPVSKLPSAEVSDLRANWSRFLEFMSKKSPATFAMMSQHSKPYEFSSEQVILICEKDFYLNALNSEAKKKIIAAAMDEFLGTKGISLTIRKPQPNDKPIDLSAVEKKNPITKLSEIKKIENPVQKETPEQEDLAEDVEEELENLAAVKVTSIQEKQFMSSDQVNMVVKLFDGKYMD